MFATLAGLLWEKQRTLETLGAVAVGVIELLGWMHGQANGAAWRPVSQASERDFAGLVERNRSNPSMPDGSFVDVPGIIGGVSCQVSRVLIEGRDGLAIEETEIRHIPLIEGLGVLGQHDIAVVRGGGSSDARAIAAIRNSFFSFVEPSDCSWLVLRLTPSLQSGSPGRRWVLS
jgi:hypothetical protein